MSPPEHCKDCTLCEHRYKIVHGSGNSSADVMFIGEAPGSDENFRGIPFIGKAGKIFDGLLQYIELPRKDVYITNIVKCRPPQNAKPSKKQISACSKYLKQEIEAVNPKFIVCLGATAGSALTGQNKDMGSLCKQAWNYEGRTVYVVYHPAAIIYNRHLYTKLEKQFEEIREHIDKDQPKERIPFQKAEETNEVMFSTIYCKELKKEDLLPSVFAQSNEEAIELIQTMLNESSTFIAIDTETTGLAFTSNRIIGISFAYRNNDNKIVSFYIPFRHRDIENTNCSIIDLKPHIQDALSNPRKRYIFHNAKFDMHMLDNEEIYITLDRIEDTMILAFIINETRKSYALKNLAMQLISPSTSFFERTLKEQVKEIGIPDDCDFLSPLNWGNISIIDMYKYACFDTILTLVLQEILSNTLRRKPKKIADGLLNVYKTEMELIPVIKKMERTGITIDTIYFSKLAGYLTLELSKIKESLVKIAGRNINFNSTQQIASVLTKVLGFTPVAITKKAGHLIVDDLALHEYYNCDFTKLLRKLRIYNKLLHTYAVSLLTKSIDGSVRTEILQSRAVNGRLASINPNLQNLPRHKASVVSENTGDLIRKGIITRKPENIFVFADYSQIELRIIAHYANVSAMKECFNNNMDLHALTASLIYGKSDVSDEERNFGKITNFLCSYGGGVRPLLNRLLKDNVEIDLSKFSSRLEFAQWLHAQFHITYPEIRNFISKAQRLTEQRYRMDKTYWVKNYFGRTRHFTADENWSCLQFLASSTAADIIKKAMIKVDNELNARKFSTKLVMQIHDELIFDFDYADCSIGVFADIVKKCMEFNELSVYIPVDIEVGNSWADKKEI